MPVRPLCAAALLVAALFAQPRSVIAQSVQQAAHVTTPKEQFGSNFGDDYFLANYKQIAEYRRKLEKESPGHGGSMTSAGHGGSMTSGWTRWILEQYEFPFQRVFAKTAGQRGSECCTGNAPASRHPLPRLPAAFNCDTETECSGCRCPATN